MVRDFCKNAGFYSYDTASVDEDPCKHWIGREVKRFIEKAEDMVPFLLQIAALPAESHAGDGDGIERQRRDGVRWRRTTSTRRHGGGH